MSRSRPLAPALLVALCIAATLAAFSATAAAAGPTRTQLLNAHLAGKFRVSGIITAASGVPGERRGRHISRAWAFGGACPRLPCAAVGLLRRRASGIDGTLLRRLSPGTYSGTGSFALAVRCAGRRYASGLIVPYRITVRVTSVKLTRLGIVVRGIRATYVSRARLNRTPCVIPRAFDSARYAGTLS